MVFPDSHTESDLPCGFTPRPVVSHIILTNGNVSRRLVQKHWRNEMNAFARSCLAILCVKFEQSINPAIKIGLNGLSLTEEGGQQRVSN